MAESRRGGARDERGARHPGRRDGERRRDDEGARHGERGRGDGSDGRLPADERRGGRLHDERTRRPSAVSGGIPRAGAAPQLKSSSERPSALASERPAARARRRPAEPQRPQQRQGAAAVPSPAGMDDPGDARQGRGGAPDARRPEREAQGAPAASARPRAARLEGGRPSRGGVAHAGSGPRRLRAASPLARGRAWGVRLTWGIVAACAIVGLAFFARPTTSEVEKRTLATFPTPSWETFWDGSFFSDVALWYSDTYPLREPMVALAQQIDSLHGVEPEAQMIGGNVAHDELPVASSSSEGSSSSSSSSSEAPAGPVEVPTSQQMQADIQANIMDGLYVKDGAAYGIYYFVQSAVDTYAKAVTTCADNLEGTADVYCMLVPNNSAVMLDADTLASLGGTDPSDALDYFYGKMGSDVKKVRILEALREHNDEYLFFRTDHHWTQLGAYYAYLEFCEVSGREPQPVLSWRQMSWDGFLGTYYSELKDPQMAANPDTVTAYVPTGTNDLTFWDEDGTSHAWKVIQDVTGWDRSSYYATFIAGDRTLEEIDNTAANPTGPVCLVIKDSYGCAFVPCLVDNYSKVYVIDYRYSSQNIEAFVREHGVSDVIFVNNMTLASVDSVSDKLLSMVQE